MIISMWVSQAPWLNPDDTRTKVKLQMDFHPDSIAEQVGDKLGFVKRQTKGDLQRFKKFIEERGRETGEWRSVVN